MAKPIPEGFHTVTPYLCISDAGKQLDWLKKVFAAKEVEKMTGPNGRVFHARVQLGDSNIMMGEPMGDMKPLQGNLYVYVKDPDATYKKAIEAGATSTNPPMDMFYGDRCGGVV